MLKQSYVSVPYVNTESVGYAYGAVHSIIIDDVDKNGFIDLVTFPSNYEVAKQMSPIVWTNKAGIFSVNNSVMSDTVSYQFLRDNAPGDFNNDGYMDYFQADQGWELNNRDPRYFFGSEPTLILGTATGLSWQKIENWLTNSEGSKSFNHIADTADYDRDGDLDVIVGAFWDFRIYENLGNARFTWHENMLPTKFNTRGGPYEVSGTTFIELGDSYALVAGPYRIWNAGMFAAPLTVLTQKNGQFVEAYTLARPDLGFGRERNYGAADMFNMDLNGDGREDLLVVWETESTQGINDGMSNMTGPAWQQRYKDLSNTILTVYFQDANGRLTPDKTFYNGHERTSGLSLYFEDFNLDGFVDFSLSSFAAKPSTFDKLIYINDGTGHFANPTTKMFAINEVFPDWYDLSPFFFDANNDGATDVVTVRQIFPNPATRSIGQEIRTFISDGPAYNITGNNKFLTVLADKTFDGGGGIDTAIFSGRFSDYTVSVNESGHITTTDKVVGRDGRDSFVNIERLRFDDRTIAIDTGLAQSAGQTALLLGAVLPGQLVFDSSKQALLGSVISLFDEGFTLKQLSGAVLRLPIWDALTGKAAPTNTDIANYLLTNVNNGLAPGASALSAAVTALDTEAVQGEWLASIAVGSANQTHINLVGLQTTGLTYLLGSWQ